MVLRSLFQNWTQLILFPGLLSLTIKWAWNLWSFPPANQTGPITVSIREEAAARPVLLELRLCSWLHSSRVRAAITSQPFCQLCLRHAFGTDSLSTGLTKISIFKICLSTRESMPTQSDFFFPLLIQFSLYTSAGNTVFLMNECCLYG